MFLIHVLAYGASFFFTADINDAYSDWTNDFKQGAVVAGGMSFRLGLVSKGKFASSFCTVDYNRARHHPPRCKRVTRLQNNNLGDSLETLPSGWSTNIDSEQNVGLRAHNFFMDVDVEQAPQTSQSRLVLLHKLI